MYSSIQKSGHAPSSIGGSRWNFSSSSYNPLNPRSKEGSDRSGGMAAGGVSSSAGGGGIGGGGGGDGGSSSSRSIFSPSKVKKVLDLLTDACHFLAGSKVNLLAHTKKKEIDKDR